MTLALNFLALAEGLSKNDERRQSIRRRAVSTAYYSVFHRLAQLCAAEFIGSDPRLRDTDEYERVYRLLDHGSVKNHFEAQPLKNHPKLRPIGEQVVSLQSERNKSDYLPSRKGLYTRSRCQTLVQSAKSTIELIDNLSREDRRTLAIFLAFKKRP